jgi:tetratricopeptide (TPR) repeat protein
VLVCGPVLALDEWIAAGEAPSRVRRRLVAAAFALDAVWAATRTPWNARRDNADPWQRVTPNEPARIQLHQFMSQPLVARWAVEQLPATGTTDSLERTLWLTAVGVAQDGHAWRIEGLSPAVLRRIPGAISQLERLLDDPAIGGEAELRTGYLELRRSRWPEALTRLDGATARITEPMLRAVAHYLAGWVYEQLERPEDAIAEYRQGLAITPAMRNLATRLSALLFLRNERADAYAILDAALNARPAPLDLLVALERADGRFVSEWLASIRRDLQ